MPTYLGSCHCGSIRFEVDAQIDDVRECDCSVCARRGGLMIRIAAEAFRLISPADAMTVYRWGTRTATDYFCSTCGILPFRQPSQPTIEERAQGIEPFEGWSVNARCLEGLDLAAIPRVRIEGRKLAI